MIDDLRHAVRLLIRHRTFSAVVLLMIGAGVGATTALFSIANALLLRPLPVKAPNELVSIYGTTKGQRLAAVSYPDFVDIRERVAPVASTIAHAPFRPAIAHRGRAEVVFAELVSHNYFRTLGVDVAAGRTFDVLSERAPAAEIVISESLWRRLFDKDPGAVGSVVKLNGESVTVAGIAAPPFKGLWMPNVVATDAWIPIGLLPRLTRSPRDLSDRSWSVVSLKSRLKAGITVSQAAGLVENTGRSLDIDVPLRSGPRELGVSRQGETYLHESVDRFAVPIATGVVAGSWLVLIVACANVGNLLLARGSARRGEIAVRMALGAAHWQLVRQLVIESVVLSSAGGLVGVVVAKALAAVLAMYVPPVLGGFVVAIDPRIDLRVLAYAGFVSILVGLIYGLPSAMRATRLAPAYHLGGHAGVVGAATRTPRVRVALVAAQVAVSILLLASAGVAIRSLGQLQHADTGFDATQAAFVEADVSLHGYSERAGRSFFDSLLASAQQLPGALSASLSDHLPLDVSAESVLLYVDAIQPADPSRGLIANRLRIERDYFRTLGIRLIEGRGFGERDTEQSPPVAVINSTAAQQLWPGQRALGRRLRVGQSGDTFAEVVGVVADTSVRFFGERRRSVIYVPFRQSYSPAMILVVRSTANPGAVLHALNGLVKRFDPDLAIVRSSSLSDHVEGLLFPMRMARTLLMAMAIAALVMASWGAYSLVAYYAVERRRELGVRLALGATMRSVVTVVTRESLVGVTAGLAAGVLLSAGVGRVASRLLVGVGTFDVVFVTIGAVVVAACGIAGGCLPAVRTATSNPADVLRDQ